MKELSYGQKLFHNKKLEQASCFFIDPIDENDRRDWRESLPKKSLRDKTQKTKDGTLCVVLSQNCDIACQNDTLDDCIEIVLCQGIKPKQVFAGNQFTKSVRKFQFKFQLVDYEASVDFIVTVNKQRLMEIIEEKKNLEIFQLDKDFKLALPFWRANRYFRSALPDSFNEKLYQILDGYISQLEEVAANSLPQYDFSSFIKGFYLNLDSMEEKESYQFEFFFLLRDEVSSELQSTIQNIVENFAEELVAISGYEDVSSIYADTETNTSVKYLTSLIRFNVDSYSLKKGDTDFIVEAD
ncbi:hypothetical protein ACT4YA_10275 [Acinetobacter baumannii]|uniref:hypothetical protein n=1 Tax=Acinetobacter sp. 1179249 TaxID=1310790 RepID=UPI0004502CF4|nr:hypothetical protein [Acinetobacter sp. 1179249]EXR29905.1 hypothetical protein J689_2927 [Acinetobacter sp. 1179249]